MSAQPGLYSALYALDLGARPLTIGLRLAASFSTLPMLFSVQAGKLADRFGSRWLLMIGAVGGLASQHAA